MLERAMLGIILGRSEIVISELELEKQLRDSSESGYTVRQDTEIRTHTMLIWKPLTVREI